MIFRVTEFYDMDTHSFTYVVHNETTREAIIIDPVLEGAHKEYIVATELNLLGILETHVHADHLTGSQELKKMFPKIPVCISDRVKLVKNNVSGFDRFLKDFEELAFGSISVKVIPTPGHTPACTSYLIGDNVFTGDALFMPDFGTGRCDFPGGSASRLFESVTKNLYTLPDATKVFVAHDYCPNGRELEFQTTIGESKAHNKHINSQTTLEEYVAFREARDKTLEPPKNIERNVAFNLNAGFSSEKSKL